jgi:hypothetical protein
MAGRRRWEDDVRGMGPADAGAWAPIAGTIAALSTHDGWVAEDPDAHLLPHLETAARGGPLAIRATRSDADGTYVVDLEWSGDGEPGRLEVRSALYALVAGIAETITVLHEPPEARGRVLEVLTGSADSAAFAGHGHTVRLAVSVPGAAPPA